MWRERDTYLSVHVCGLLARDVGGHAAEGGKAG